MGILSEKDQHLEKKPIRIFDTGANRDADEGKLDYEAFLSPLVLERYAEYLHEHRKLPDGAMRDGDNWQKGMPLDVYMKSGWRHLHAWWKAHRGWFKNPLTSKADREKALEDTICAVIFNASGYLHEVLKVKLVEEAPEKSLHQKGIEAIDRDLGKGVLGISPKKITEKEMDDAGVVAVSLWAD